MAAMGCVGRTKVVVVVLVDVVVVVTVAAQPHVPPVS